MTGTDPSAPIDPSSVASKRPQHAQLLADLLSDTLDPGYRAAARRRAARAGDGGEDDDGKRWYDRPAVALGCLLAGFVLVVAYVHTNRAAPEEALVHSQLVARVRSAEQGNTALDAQLSQVQRRLASAQAQLLPSSGALAKRLAVEQQADGTVAVHGPGLVVTLREPPTSTSTDALGRAGSTPITATNILTDRDVRSVVNELWIDGAEAIAVNGIRLTPTSAIRFAGEAVLVDFYPISSPYTIAAVGDPDVLSTRFASSAVASRYQTLVSADGIGFTFSNEDDVVLPAGTEVNPRYASPMVSSSTAPSPHQTSTAGGR